MQAAGQGDSALSNVFGGLSGIQRFKDAVIDLQGGIKGVDSIPSLLMPGESVMTTEETTRFKPMFEGIRKGLIKDMHDVAGMQMAIAKKPQPKQKGKSYQSGNKQPIVNVSWQSVEGQLVRVEKELNKIKRYYLR